MNEAERRFVRMKASGRADGWFEANDARRMQRAELERLWEDLDQLPDLAQLAAPAIRSVALPRRKFLAWTAAGGGAVLASGLTAVLLFRSDLASETGALRNAALPDGSHVLLDADSAIDLHFAGSQREISLIRGRAQFDIVPGQGLFVIRSGSGRVEVESGLVSAHLWADSMCVTCMRGQAHLTASDGAVFTLAAGEQATVGGLDAEAPRPLTPGEEAWRSGRLVFDNRPLRQVVADLDRYRPGRIILRGAATGDLRVTGVFNAARPEDALAAIEAALPVWRQNLGPVTLIGQS